MKLCRRIFHDIKRTIWPPVDGATPRNMGERKDFPLIVTGGTLLCFNAGYGKQQFRIPCHRCFHSHYHR